MNSLIHERGNYLNFVLDYRVATFPLRRMQVASYFKVLYTSEISPLLIASELMRLIINMQSSNQLTGINARVSPSLQYP